MGIFALNSGMWWGQVAIRVGTAGGFTVFSIGIPLSVSKKGYGDAAGSGAPQWAQGVGDLPEGWRAQGLVARASEGG